MICVEVLEFCEDNAISIEKFLQDNFSLESYVFKKNPKNKRWRIKHNEIAGWYNVIPVSLMFAYRYKHLVLTGKLIIVRDDFGKYSRRQQGSGLRGGGFHGDGRGFRRVCSHHHGGRGVYAL